ncbi:MAG: AtpZ/AtpI family protein [Erysipelotrichales bacterium]|jgi:F0F1-type ATP synthase assembly protein I|nr:AtpZ/AtpI family protein [Erysipelotrichales bacterium]MBQ1386412.1 AtpZ/AtpI family protein [Erysipelotrichales bacterium]MBQ2309887.1 AtpZ/AtpI family protein [Erysipelotrichales bacterium]MBQ2478520.1 AtpZ/AtpI family protein [Erysipelotrichales bacterium]MBQ4011106.1 AtpZ/AtpI family protein [Erysipelotrichales bacterium]
MGFWKALAMGTVIVSNILLGLGIGWWLDSHFATKPLWIVIGTVTGVLAALVWLFRLGKENAR